MTNDTKYTQIGGARVGWNSWIILNFSIPFAKITITHDEISLKLSFFGLGKTYSIERKQIRFLTECNGMFSKGIIIEHKASSCPEFMVFWSRNQDELKIKLESLGYELLV